MDKQTQSYASDPTEWLGDLHPLAEQLGSTEGLVCLASVSALLQLGPVNSISSLRRFLRDYQQRILFPFELPAIESAYEHAVSNETRELIALDSRLVSKNLSGDFA